MKYYSNLCSVARALAAVCLLLVGGLSAASAQVLTSFSSDTGRTTSLIYGLGGQIGYFKSSGADVGAAYFGLVGHARVGSFLAVEGALGYRGSQQFNFGRVNGADLSAQVHSIPLSLSLLIRLPFRGDLSTYVLGGASLSITTIDYSADINKVLADETPTKGALHLGIGFEYPLNRSIGVHADYRYLFLGSVFSSAPPYDFSGKNYGGSQAAAGLLVYF